MGLPALTESERKVLTDNYDLYRALKSGARPPSSDDERHFVQVCCGLAVPRTELAKAYRKMKSLLTVTGVHEDAFVLAGFVIPGAPEPVCASPEFTSPFSPKDHVPKEHNGSDHKAARRTENDARHGSRCPAGPAPAFTRNDIVRLLEFSLEGQDITAAKSLFWMFTPSQIKQVYDASEAQQRTMLKTILEEMGDDATASWTRPFHDHRSAAQSTKMREQATDPSNR